MHVVTPSKRGEHAATFTWRLEMSVPYSFDLRGPWFISDTVFSDRKNLFCMAPAQEFHIGTFVSGSLSQLERFDAALSLIRRAPDMASALVDLVVALEQQDPGDEALTQALLKARELLKHLGPP